MCFKPEAPLPGILERLKKFVQDFCEKWLSPLEANTNLELEHWLAQTTYPEWRKEQLREEFKRIENRKDRKHFLLKCFVKDEPYVDYKYPRGIMSRTDAFKTLVGPTFKAIESVVFKLPWFIKKVPVNARPDYIIEHLYRENGVYLATDYTAFESLFTADLMRSCEFVLYKHMTKYLPNKEEFNFYLEKVLAGRNFCQFKYFDVSLDASRMSGEMCTSLGNGFSNLMFMLFCCDQVGATDVAGVVEGDDGLFVMKGAVPTAQHFKDLGLEIKLDIHTQLTEASFCGLIFDLDDRINITDVVPQLLVFGWTKAKYARSSQKKKMMLLTSKALSLAYQYNGCPVLTELARTVLRIVPMQKKRLSRYILTSRDINEYRRPILIEALSVMDPDFKWKEPPIQTRLLVEKKFGLDVPTQRYWEEQIRNMKEVAPLSLSNIDLYCHPSWKDYSNRYSVGHEVPHFNPQAQQRTAEIEENLKVSLIPPEKIYHLQ